MMGNLAQDWPVYFLLGIVVIFFGYAIIKSNFPSRKDRPEQNKPTGTK